MDMKKYITLLENNSKLKEVVVKPIQPKVEPQPQVHISESYNSSPAIRKIVRNVMEKKTPQPPKARNPVAKNANAAVGGGAAGKHKDRKKDAKQGVQKHKGQELDEYSMQQFGQDAGDFGRGAWNGLTLGTGDNIVAGAKSLIGGGKYKDELAKQTAASKEAEQRSPWLYGAGNVAGSLAMPVPGGAIAGGLIKGASTGAKLARGATTIGANLATQAAIDKAKNVADVSTLGYNPNKYPTTRQEIIAFQQANGLKADGVIGKNTSTKLAGMGLTPPQAVAEKRSDSQELDEYFEKEKPTDGELLLLMKKYRLAKISGKPLGSVMRQSDIHKLIDAEKDGRIEALKYKDSIDERYDDEDDQEYTSKSDFKRRELEHELGHETRSGAVYIDGRYWKTFDTYKQAQNIARSLERKGKNATARMLESKKPKKTAQEKLSAAVDRERKKNEPATRRAKQELDAAMPSKALAEGRVCPQCGSSKCSCPPGKCKCKPVAGFKPKMSEDKDPCWKNYKMVGTKKKGSRTVPNCVPKESRMGEAQNAAQQAAIAIAKKKKAKLKETQLDELDRPSGKLYIIITADNAGAPHVFGDFGSFPQDVMHKVSKRGTRDKSGTKTKLKIDFLFDDFRTTIQHLRTIFRDLDFIGAEAAEFIIKSSALRSDQGEDVKHLKDYIESGDDRRMKMYQAPEDDEEGEPTGGNMLRIDPETGAARRVVGVKPQTQMGGKSTEQPGMTTYRFKDPRFAQQLRGMNLGFNIKGDSITVDQKQKQKLVSMLGDKFSDVFTNKELFKEGGDKYKIQSTGSDINPATGKRANYYISPSTGKKVYKDSVKKGDHENPKSGEHKPKVEGQIAQAIMKEFGLT